jgi:hypothetical protein
MNVIQIKDQLFWIHLEMLSAMIMDKCICISVYKTPKQIWIQFQPMSQSIPMKNSYISFFSLIQLNPIWIMP